MNWFIYYSFVDQKQLIILISDSWAIWDQDADDNEHEFQTLDLERKLYLSIVIGLLYPWNLVLYFEICETVHESK